MVPVERIELPTIALRRRCTAAVLHRLKFTNGRDLPGQKHSLPETTVCRSTKGDRYRISGPSYVLAGTAILKRNQFTSSCSLSLPAVARRRRSVEVIEIDLQCLRPGHAAARHDGAHESERNRRGEDPLVGIPSPGGGAGQLALLCLGAERENSRSAVTLLLSPWSSRDFRVSDSLDLGSSRTCATNHTAE
jgi:hypothetical protein